MRRPPHVEKKILEVGPENVAAFIGEPIQGAAGVLIPPSTYWPEVQRICRKYGVLIISDEVICGFGRTGNWWGFETLGFEPDIVAMAKGLSSGYLPIGAVAFADTLLKDFFDQGGEFYHGMTYAGHPVAAAVALKNIEIIEDEKLVERVAELGPYFAKALASLNDHPIVGETRSMGLIGAIELSSDKAKRGAFQGFGPGRHDLPRPLLQEQPDHAGLLGHHGAGAALHHHQEGDRRNGQTGPRWRSTRPMRTSRLRCN